MKKPPPKTQTWPDDVVDASRLFEVLGYRSGAPEVVGSEVAERIRAMEAAVERARISGRIRRLSARRPGTEDAVAYGYRRADVRRAIGLE